MNKVSEFQGKYRFLSNFWWSEVEFEGINYPSVEHAYQAAKTTDLTLRQTIARAVSPGDAKRHGRHLSLQDNWESLKESVMKQLLECKFAAGTELADKLLGTGDAILEEGNKWNDRYWGVCPPNSGNGQNRLGQLLMQVRAELKKAGEE